MPKSNNSSKGLLADRKDINKIRRTQTKRFYNYLRTRRATCSQASRFLRIPQKCLTRYKRDLERAGLLWEAGLTKCPITGFPAALITTGEHLALVKPQQLKLL